MTIGERFKIFRKSLKMTQGEMGAVVGKSVSTIQKYEFGKRNIEESALMVLNMKLGLNLEWLNTGEGNMLMNDVKGMVKIPIYEQNQIITPKNIVGYYECPEKTSIFDIENSFMILVKDSRLTPAIQKGDLLAISPKTGQRTNGYYLCEFNKIPQLREIFFHERHVILSYSTRNKSTDAKRTETSIVKYEDLKLLGKVVWLSRAITD